MLEGFVQGAAATVTTVTAMSAVFVGGGTPTPYTRPQSHGTK
jgi:hypothetical protein